MNETARHWDVVAYETRDMEVVMIDSSGNITTPVKMCKLVDAHDKVRATTYTAVMLEELTCPGCREAFSRQIFGISYDALREWCRLDPSPRNPL